jgi:tetratricopeptide (TPR) repeat protein
MALADAYAKLHSLDNSIIVYQKVVEYARQNQTQLTEKEALQGLGRLYISKFDYPNAATVYEELLELSTSSTNTYAGRLIFTSIS